MDLFNLAHTYIRWIQETRNIKPPWYRYPGRRFLFALVVVGRYTDGDQNKKWFNQIQYEMDYVVHTYRRGH